MVKCFIGGLYPLLDISLCNDTEEPSIIGSFIDMSEAKWLVSCHNFPEEAKDVLTNSSTSIAKVFTNFFYSENRNWRVIFFTSGTVCIYRKDEGGEYLYATRLYTIINATDPAKSNFNFDRSYDTVGYIVENKNPYLLVVDTQERRLVHAVRENGLPSHYYFYNSPLPGTEFFDVDQARIRALNKVENKTGLYLCNGLYFTEEMIRYEYNEDLPQLPEGFSKIENITYGHWR